MTPLTARHWYNWRETCDKFCCCMSWSEVSAAVFRNVSADFGKYCILKVGCGFAPWVRYTTLLWFTNIWLCTEQTRQSELSASIHSEQTCSQKHVWLTTWLILEAALGYTNRSIHIQGCNSCKLIVILRE